MSYFETFSSLLTQFDPQTGTVGAGASRVERRLSDMRGYFADEIAYQARLSEDDPILYTVENVETFASEGDLYYGIGMIAPGRIGGEYFMTKGHYHQWREAAEFYIGLQGEGFMLLEHEQTQETRMLPLTPNCAVYVPGYTAHRTVNTGNTPLTYLGICPARAGHDYGTIVERNFLHVIVAQNGHPTLVKRSDYISSLQTEDKSS